MNPRIAVATLVLALVPAGSCVAQETKVVPPQPMTLKGPAIERVRDINLTDAQEAAIAAIRDEYAPRVEDALDHLGAVVKEEADQVRGVLTPDQLRKLQGMKEERTMLRVEGLASRIAHLRDLDLTDDEMARIADIRKEYRPKIIKELENLKGILTPEQARLREEALRAGKPRREVVAALKLTDEQKQKVEGVGNEVRALVREELKKMRDVLDPDQKEKLAAMKADRREHVRDRLAFAIANFKELELTPDQVKQIESIRAEYRPRVQQAGNDVRAIVREELAAILGVLKT